MVEVTKNKSAIIGLNMKYLMVANFYSDGYKRLAYIGLMRKFITHNCPQKNMSDGGQD